MLVHLKQGSLARRAWFKHADGRQRHCARLLQEPGRIGARREDGQSAQDVPKHVPHLVLTAVERQAHVVCGAYDEYRGLADSDSVSVT